MTMKRFSHPAVPPLPDKAPTKIIEPPWVAIGPTGKKTMWLMTDVGLLLMQQVAQLKRLSRLTLYNRITCYDLAWKDEDIFCEARKKKPRPPGSKRYTGTKDIEEIPRRRRRYPEDIRVGTWERKDKVWSRFRRESIIAALPGRDSEYNELLRHHRSVCR